MKIAYFVLYVVSVNSKVYFLSSRRATSLSSLSSYVMVRIYAKHCLA